MFKNVIKVAVIGTDNTGKSCLCNAIAGRKLEKEYISTIGVDFIVNHIARKNYIISLGLWDLAGLDRFSSITIQYVNSSSVLLYCYSSEKLDTFTKMVSKYYEHKNYGYLQDKHIIIVVTKTDSNKTKTGYEKWGQDFAEKHYHPFIKTSSYTNEGIKELTNSCIIIYDPLIEEPVKYRCILS
jgi:Ras-related protein Rab-7A